MNNDTYIIGYYKLPNSFKSTVYTENTKTYKKEIYEIEHDEVDNLIEKLKQTYPNHQVCKFVY